MVRRDGVAPPEPKGNRFTVCPATIYGITTQYENIHKGLLALFQGTLQGYHSNR